MNIDGEICAYVRGCKNKHAAISMASTLFCVTTGRVVSALTTYGLLDRYGKYIEPLRLTGKEITVEKRKINYPEFPWSTKRQAKLRELYQAGATIAEIAAELGTDEETVYNGVAKFNLVRITHVSAKEEPAPPSAAEPETPSATYANLKTMESNPATTLENLKRNLFVAANYNSIAMDNLLALKDREVCFSLGQQSVYLSEAAKLLDALFPHEP